MAVSPTGPPLYVVGHGEPVVVIDTATNTVIDTIPGGGYDGLAVSPDSATVYLVHDRRVTTAPSRPTAAESGW
jgi:YVTN family beta-propeller protein